MYFALHKNSFFHHLHSILGLIRKEDASLIPFDIHKINEMQFDEVLFSVESVLRLLSGSFLNNFARKRKGLRGRNEEKREGDESEEEIDLRNPLSAPLHQPDEASNSLIPPSPIPVEPPSPIPRFEAKSVGEFQQLIRNSQSNDPSEWKVYIVIEESDGEELNSFLVDPQDIIERNPLFGTRPFDNPSLRDPN